MGVGKDSSGYQRFTMQADDYIATKLINCRTQAQPSHIVYASFLEDYMSSIAEIISLAFV